MKLRGGGAMQGKRIWFHQYSKELFFKRYVYQRSQKLQKNPSKKSITGF